MANISPKMSQCFIHPTPMWSVGVNRNISNISHRPRSNQYNTSTTKRVTPSCVWVERSATVNVEMNSKEAFDYYSDLEAMPEWSPWLRSVVVDDWEQGISRWTLAAKGLEVSWKAKNTEVKRGEIIAWESQSGLKNRGRVTFVENNEEKTAVTLAVEFDVPAAIARVINNDFIGRFVEETLLADMKRFRSVALLKKRKRARAVKSQ